MSSLLLSRCLCKNPMAGSAQLRIEKLCLLMLKKKTVTYCLQNNINSTSAKVIWRVTIKRTKLILTTLFLLFYFATAITDFLKSGPFPSRPLFIYFCLFNTVDNKHVNKQMFNKILLMTWVELQTSGIVSDHYTNWATTTSQQSLISFESQQ